MLSLIKGEVMSKVKAIVIGGSLAGLTTAIALEKAGLSVKLFEKKKRMPGTAGGLGVTPPQFDDNPMAKFLKSIILDSDEEALASYGHIARRWEEVYAALLDYLENETQIQLYFDHPVLKVGQTESYAYAQSAVSEYQADLLIGADGHRSLVRKEVAPQKPDATYAGYVNWMGSVFESEIDSSLWEIESRLGYEYVLDGPNKILIGFIMPGEGEKGERIISFAQYDASSNDIARRTGALKGDKAMHSISADDISKEELEHLIERTKQHPWPEPFQTAMLKSFERREFRGILLKEYVPEQLSKGRIAIVSDAAHSATSWTGMGYNASLQDAACIAQLIIDTQPTTKEIPEILHHYQDLRLETVRAIVERGHMFSRSFRVEEFG